MVAMEPDEDSITFREGRRPRGVGTNCLVALQREAWRNEIGNMQILSLLLPCFAKLVSRVGSTTPATLILPTKSP